MLHEKRPVCFCYRKSIGLSISATDLVVSMVGIFFDFQPMVGLLVQEWKGTF